MLFQSYRNLCLLNSPVDFGQLCSPRYEADSPERLEAFQESLPFGQ